MASIIYKLESFEIIGACFEVYKEKGCGFLEAVYQEWNWNWATGMFHSL